MEIKAYLFDMDHTLINNDCDVSWKEFLIEEKIADKNILEMVDFYFEQYKQGELQIADFMQFQIAEFLGKTPQEMQKLTEKHFEKWVKKTIYNSAFDKIKEVLATAKPVALLTATNKIIAKPVADFLGIKTVLACDIKVKNGVYTNDLTPFSYGEGKIPYAKEFAQENGITLQDCAYFGDSTSDIKILSEVGFPNAVNPSDKLREEASKNGWNIVEFK